MYELCRDASLLCLVFGFLACLASADDDRTIAAICPSPDELQDQASEVSGFSVFSTHPDDAAAFLQDLRPLIAASRAEPGNVEYVMYTNPTAPGVIGFTERYKDLTALSDHLEAEHVASIFDHRYYKTLKVGNAQLFGPWKEVVPGGCADDEDEIEMVFYWNVNCSNQHVWDIITDWTDASWVKDVVNTTIVPLREDGTVMSKDEAEAYGDVDLLGGLGPVVQRRTFSNGRETVTPLIFPNVKFGKFLVTISLLSDGLDKDSETRIRYHIRATVEEGSTEQGRLTLKSDFYGPRIAYYQQYFNCSIGVSIKAAERGIDELYLALDDGDRDALAANLFVEETAATKYLQQTLGSKTRAADARVQILTPVKPVVLPDLRVMVVEDVVIHSFKGTSVLPRIALYQMDPWGRVISAKLYDTLAADCDERDGCEGAKLIDATNRYFDVLKSRDLEKIRELYVEDECQLELHDPVGFRPERTFESVYNNFITIVDAFEYTRYPARTFVDMETRQTAQLVDAWFQGAGGLGEFKAQPVQVFTFDNELKIKKFEAFFEPRVVNLSKQT